MSSRSFDLSQVHNHIDSTGAVKLDGHAASHYLDYNNFTNTPTIPTNNNQLTNGAGYTTNAGTVTSVATTVPTGFAISGSPITTSGTLAITYSAGYQGYTSTEASKLAGIESGATADQTASEILTAIKTVDGAASGLDADLLDGQHGSYYYAASNPNGYTTNTGTVTSIAATVPTGFSISGSPITSSGTLAITYSTGYQGYTSTEASKLAGIETGATADQTASEILTAIKTVDGATSGLDADLLDGQHGSYYASLASPTFTGTPAAPTAIAGTNTTQIATTAFVSTAVSNLVDAAPGTLDTLNELAAALGDDPNFATTVSNSIGTKLPLAGGTMTGAITFAAGQTFDGRDVSADGAKLDGIEAGATGDQTASEILTLIKTVDGSGSGLDADTLDGIQASSFSQTSHNHTLDGLSNTTITSNTSGEILKWNGSAWVNNTLAEAGIQPAGSYLTGNQTITLSGDLSGSGTTSINAQIAANAVGANELNVSGNGTAGQFLISDGDGSFSWSTGGASAISNVVEDTTPQLGGNLDLNSNDITGTGNINITGTISSSTIAMSNGNITGVNQLQINDPGEGVLFRGTTNVHLYAIDDATDAIMNFDNASELRRNGNKVWDEGNDGTLLKTSGGTISGNLDVTGYIDGEVTRIKSWDVRYSAQVPGTTGANTYMPNANDSWLDNSTKTIFSYSQGGAGWSGVLTTKGWNGTNYAAWQLSGTAHTSTWGELYFRDGVGGSWNTWRKVWHDGNLTQGSSLTIYNSAGTALKTINGIST
jgi:DNA-binding FrmR family transcriptional regulator